MIRTPLLRILGVMLVVLTLGPSATRAEFRLFEDFDGLEPEPIDDQHGWYAENDTSVVAFDPANYENQVLAVTTDSTHLYRELLLLDGTVRMMFLRFRFGGQQNYSFGMTPTYNPDRFGHFASELSMSNASNELRINDDGTYEVLGELQPNVWYNCWLLIDNFGETTQVWLHTRPGDGAGDDDQQDSDGQTLFVFRNGAANTLVNFFIKTAGGDGPSGPLLLDDVYLEDTNALNLRNPAAPNGGAAAGRVPAQPLWTGRPLTLDKASAEEIRLDWAESCLDRDTDYEIYVGRLGDYYSHVWRFCSTRGATTLTFPHLNGNQYYLVVPRNSQVEGSYGTDGIKVERPRGDPACLTQSLGDCP